MNMIICPNCEGMGNIILQSDMLPDDWKENERPDLSDEQIATCPDCNGKGFTGTPDTILVGTQPHYPVFFKFRIGCGEYEFFHLGLVPIAVSNKRPIRQVLEEMISTWYVDFKGKKNPDDGAWYFFDGEVCVSLEDWDTIQPGQWIVLKEFLSVS